MSARRREVLTVLSLLALLPGCAAVGTGTAARAAAARLTGGADSAFFDARTGQRLSRRHLLRRLSAVPIILLGEVHDNTAHHRIRAGLLLEWILCRPDRPAAVVFEHLDREHDDALRLAQKLQKGGGDAALEALLQAARFDRQGWGWPAHRPLFEAAQASGATWIAANLSRASARRLSRDRGARLDPALQAMLESSRWTEGAQSALAQALEQGHCGLLPAAAVPAVVRLQRLRDAALALPLLDANERRTVLLAGNAHVRKDYGVPLYLGALEHEALVIGFEERPGLSSDPLQAFAHAYDFVCLTTSPPREDPCAALLPPAAREGAIGAEFTMGEFQRDRERASGS